MKYYLRGARHLLSWFKSASMDASQPIRFIWFEVALVVGFLLLIRPLLGFAFDISVQLLLPLVVAFFFFRKGGKRIGAMRKVSKSNRQVKFKEFRCSDPPIVR